MSNSIYPAVLSYQRTLLCDNDLVAAVRAGCGDDLADVLRVRLESDALSGSVLDDLKDALCRIRSAISEAEDVESALEGAIKHAKG